MRLTLVLFFAACINLYGQYPAGNTDPGPGYLIKLDGKVNYISTGNLEVVKETFSLQNGILIKPEGVIILGNGRQIVLKNGEITDLTGLPLKAADSVIQEVRFKQLEKKIDKLNQKQLLLQKSLDLANRKTELLEKKTDLINEKADLCGKKSSAFPNRSKDQNTAELNEIDRQITEIEKDIKELEKTFAKAGFQQ